MTIRPHGWEAPLPDVPDYVGYTQMDKDRAVSWFNENFPKYSGILDEWEYDPDTNRFYNPYTDRSMTESQLRQLVERYIDERSSVLDQLIGTLLAGLFLPRWINQMRDVIDDTYLVAYLLGRGGLDGMAESDWLDLSGLLRNQYQYLNGFGQSIAEGTLSEAQMLAQATLYLNSSRQAFERARTMGAWGMPELPAYPGDGTSECRVNCKCHWRIVPFEDHWECYWIRTARESCPTCVERASAWAPFVVYRRM